MQYGVLPPGTKLFRAHLLPDTLWRNYPQAWFGDWDMLKQMVIDYGRYVTEFSAPRPLSLLKMDSVQTIRSLRDIFLYVCGIDESDIRNNLDSAFQIRKDASGQEFVYRNTMRDTDLWVAQKIGKCTEERIDGWYHADMIATPSSNNKGVLRAEVMLLDGRKVLNIVNKHVISVDPRSPQGTSLRNKEMSEETRLRRKRPPPGTPEGTPTKPPKRNRDDSPGAGPSSGRRLFGTPSPPRTPKPGGK